LSFYFWDAVKTAAGHAAKTKRVCSMKVVHPTGPKQILKKWHGMSSEQSEAEKIETKQQSFGQRLRGCRRSKVNLLKLLHSESFHSLNSSDKLVTITTTKLMATHK
jgi:hypothetical protein